MATRSRLLADTPHVAARVERGVYAAALLGARPRGAFRSRQRMWSRPRGSSGRRAVLFNPAGRLVGLAMLDCEPVCGGEA